MIRLILTIGLLVPLTLLFSKEIKNTKNLNMDAQSVNELKIECGAGFLKVRGNDDADRIVVKAEVEMDVSSQDEMNELLDKYLNLSLEQKGDRAQLKSSIDIPGSVFSFLSGSPGAVVNLTVEIPSRLALNVDDGSGLIEIKHIQGSVQVDDGSGALTIHDIQNKVLINDGSGEIDIANVNGLLSVEDGSGALIVEKVVGDVRIDDGSGGIRVEEIQGNLTADDGSGEMWIKNIRGHLKVDDGSGEIEISDIKETVEIHDRSGSITINGVGSDVTIYESGSGDVNISGVEGRIERRDK